MTTTTVTSFTGYMKDLYPRPGDRMKQWVVDLRREEAWEQETCPHVAVPPHEDDEGEPCTTGLVRHAPWIDLRRERGCQFCWQLAQRVVAPRPAWYRPILRRRWDHAASSEIRAAVTAWVAAKAKRPPLCTDRSILSDEIAPDLALGEHPLLKLVRR